jgi:hypothetical protein
MDASHRKLMTQEQIRLRPVHLAVVMLAALIWPGDGAAARGGGSERSLEAVAPRIAGEPIMAIVSLQSQRITIYDDKGWILRAPVSSGQRGRETPAGIFSVIQKEAEHYSNLYDDAYMPNMQRLTWSGIALHGGVLPGYPASHGCIRMPYDFAARLFDATELGLRVFVSPRDVAPVDIVHPVLFQPKPGAGALAAARIAEADEATRNANQARRAAGAAFRDVAQAMVPVRAAANLKLRAEAQLTAAEAALGAASSDEAKRQAEEAKAQATARIAELQAQWDAANAELQPKRDALVAARQAALAAEAVQSAATDAARQAAHELEPVSVLISRKTQRLYVRQAFEPVFDGPVTIQDPDRPIGTHVFTAIERSADGTGLRWSVVSLDGDRGGASTSETAKAALDRIVIPQETLDRIPGAGVRSSLIVTDEALSSETSKGTDFVVLLSGEPQGGIKYRRRAPATEYGYVRQRERLPYWGWGSFPRGPSSTW